MSEAGNSLPARDLRRNLHPTPTPEERKAAIERYIAEYNRAYAAASPAERELEALERKTRLSPEELSRYRDLQAQVCKVA
jgi:hypothetical protein